MPCVRIFGGFDAKRKYPIECVRNIINRIKFEVSLETGTFCFVFIC